MRQQDLKTCFLLSQSIMSQVENIQGVEIVALRTMSFQFKRLGDTLYKVYLPSTDRVIYHDLDPFWCFYHYQLMV